VALGGEDREASQIEIVSEPFSSGSEDVDTALARLRDHPRQHHWTPLSG